jgi:hypothetical protein
MRNSRLTSHRFKAPHALTSMRPANEEWDAFNERRRRDAITDTEAIGRARGMRVSGSLTSAVRVHLLS